jgi:molecular chaperone HscB
MTCWSCRAPAGSVDVCAACGALQPSPPGRDLFQVLGLPRAFALDGAALERRFRELSRQFHPDRFAQASAPERRISLDRSTAINDAYRTLRDPVRRAAYLLKLHGISVDDEGRGTGTKVTLPPAFLEEVMELREGFLDADGPEQKTAMVSKVRAQKAAVMASVERRLTDLGAAPTPDELKAAGEELAKLRYFERFLEEAAPHAQPGDESHP